MDIVRKERQVNSKYELDWQLDMLMGYGGSEIGKIVLNYVRKALKCTIDLRLVRIYNSTNIII